jgi:iron complex transport system substrate-binding protein
MSRTSIFATIVTAALALAACGGDDGSSGDADSSARAVVDGAGRSVEVPASPQRVVFMDETTMGNAIALGLPPERIVGAAFFDGQTEPYEWIEEDYDVDLSAFTPVGFVDAPNYELIAELRPDLIFLLSGFDAQLDLLGEIAPVFVATNSRETVDEMLAMLGQIGEALGLQAEATRLADQVEERIDGLVDEFGDSGLAVTSLYVSDGFFGASAHPVLDRIGLARQCPPPGETWQELSIENIDCADGDGIWVTGFPDGEAEIRRMLEAIPAWQAMDVARTGNVRVTRDLPWSTDWSYPALDYQIDQIEAGLSEWR